jgi:ketosteroid isomerase-like protein
MPDVQIADDRFFAALLAADAPALGELLADGFTIIDVIGGSVVARDPFVAAIRDRILGIQEIDVVERDARAYGDETAIVVGRTRMAGTFAGSPFEVKSRYTHVFVLVDGSWRLASAQGTQIADAS